MEAGVSQRPVDPLPPSLLSPSRVSLQRVLWAPVHPHPASRAGDQPCLVAACRESVQSPGIMLSSIQWWNCAPRGWDRRQNPPEGKQPKSAQSCQHPGEAQYWRPGRASGAATVIWGFTERFYMKTSLYTMNVFTAGVRDQNICYWCQAAQRGLNCLFNCWYIQFYSSDEVTVIGLNLAICFLLFLKTLIGIFKS